MLYSHHNYLEESLNWKIKGRFSNDFLKDLTSTQGNASEIQQSRYSIRVDYKRQQLKIT
jgi:hypothetical protein